MEKLPKKFEQKILFICIAAFLTYYAISQIQTINSVITTFFKIMTPFFIGFGIAYILNQPMEKLKQRFKIKHNLSVMIIYLSAIIIITLFSSYFIPIIANNIMTLSAEIPKSVDLLTKTVNNVDWGPLRDIIQKNMPRFAEFITTISNFVVGNISQIMINFGAAFMNIFFGIIISIYLLIDKEKLITNFQRLGFILFGKKKGDSLIELFNDANAIFSHYIIGLILEAIIVGIIATICFHFAGVRYASTLGFIICLTNVIPYVGPFIGAVPAVTATMMYNPILAIYVAIFIIILQQIDANFIGPKIMGNFIGLDPIWIIFSITIGGGFFGFLGILLAIPMGAFLKIIITSYLKKYDKLHHDIIDKL